MIQLVVTLAVTGASAALMYTVCLRPMLRNHRVAALDTTRHELAQLRRAISELRHQSGAQ